MKRTYVLRLHFSPDSLVVLRFSGTLRVSQDSVKPHGWTDWPLALSTASFATHRTDWGPMRSFSLQKPECLTCSLTFHRFVSSQICSNRDCVFSKDTFRRKSRSAVDSVWSFPPTPATIHCLPLHWRYWRFWRYAVKNLFVILTATDEKVSAEIKVWILTSWTEFKR